MVNSTIFAIVLVCVIGIIAVVANSKMRETKMSLVEKTEMKQKGEVTKGAEEPQAITISTREKNRNNYTEVTSEDGKPVPVPKGYVASPNVEERYVNGVTTEGVREHHGGFVIYERLASDAGKTDKEVQDIIEDDMDEAQRTRNQWVWVPIADVTDMYHASGNLIYANQYTFSASSYSKSTGNNREPMVVNYDADHYATNNYHFKQYLEEISRNEFLQEMREEFYEMIESVKEYGGFYIGRYETGDISSKVPVVKKGNNTISSVEWWRMYKGSKNLKGSNKTVQTGLIWGIQWDETLKWLIDSGEKTYAEINNSTTWGNYSDNTASGHGSKRATGYSESWKANNIYDLAGNVWELTMEAQGGSGRYVRGGDFTYNGSVAPASNRGNSVPYKSNNYKRVQGGTVCLVKICERKRANFHNHKFT